MSSILNQYFLRQTVSFQFMYWSPLLFFFLCYFLKHLLYFFFFSSRGLIYIRCYLCLPYTCSALCLFQFQPIFLLVLCFSPRYFLCLDSSCFISLYHLFLELLYLLFEIVYFVQLIYYMFLYLFIDYMPSYSATIFLCSITHLSYSSCFSPFCLNHNY